MNKSNQSSSDVSRRQFVARSGLAVAGALVAPYVITSHAAPDDPIRLGLIGCGSRGTGAVGNVFSSTSNVKLVALADLFPDRMKICREELKKMAEQGNKANSWAAGTESGQIKGVSLDLPDDMCFTGFDSYKKLLAISDINYVILASPPHFRPIHLRAAVEAGKNVFMEKPVAVDGPGVRSVIESGEIAKKKGLGIVAGTQRRHQNNYVEAVKRIQDGAIGDITSARAFWCQGGVWVKPREAGWTDMEWHLRNWTYFTWLAGDHIVEQHMHNIDVINWVMGKHPITALGLGGRQARTGPEYGMIYDHFAVEYEYQGGVRMTSLSRQIDRCSSTIGEAVVGTKGRSDCCRIITGENPWRFAGKLINPYEQEHVDLIKSIREGKPLNEAQQAAESTLTAIMGRESAYSGQIIDWDSALESTMDLSPAKYEFGALPAPVVPIPGKYKFE
ncbi:MAG TPA: Gfo/Idh/MocA family oxidoreductase [Candidatus Paceibacterota bacterium]|nr:Gfo/Idh/MocA family oxidoreductase [Verrucomicrobiota bacterium]HRY50941.1 Gfo/Idh/MocA family oxidoreductase [Candidatus Paceibacterota bacterium]